MSVLGYQGRRQLLKNDLAMKHQRRFNMSAELGREVVVGGEHEGSSGDLLARKW